MYICIMNAATILIYICGTIISYLVIKYSSIFDLEFTRYKKRATLFMSLFSWVSLAAFILIKYMTNDKNSN